MPRRLLLLPLFVVALLLVSSPIRAQESDAEPDAEETDTEPGGGAGGANGSKWSVTFLGGAIMPLGTMIDTHQNGLTAGGRLGWTGRSGLGLDLNVRYAPLPRVSTGGPERFDTHFLTAGLMPRFTLGKEIVRVWLGAGGGLAYEQRIQYLEEAGVELSETSHTLAAAATAAVGLEFHFLSGAGLTAVGSYTRLYGGLDYEYLNVMGGLVLEF